MTIALCHYTMQLCPSNNSVTAHFCTSECNDLYVKCGQFILQLEEYVNNIPRDEAFSFPRCFELNNASEFRVSSNETCAKLGLGQYKTILCIIVSFIRSTTPQLSAWNHLLCIIVTLSLLMFKHSCLRRNEEVGSLRKRATLSSSSNLAWFQKQKKIGGSRKSSASNPSSTNSPNIQAKHHEALIRKFQWKSSPFSNPLGFCVTLSCRNEVSKEAKKIKGKRYKMEFRRAFFVCFSFLFFSRGHWLLKF